MIVSHIIDDMISMIPILILIPIQYDNDMTSLIMVQFSPIESPAVIILTCSYSLLCFVSCDDY
jgi:hypothetical protein